MNRKKKAGVWTALLLTAVLPLSACGGSATTVEEEAPERQESETKEAATLQQESEEKEATLEQRESETEETADAAEEEAPSEETTDPAKEEPATLEFVDAHGEWHETEIDEAVEPHAFDWDALSGSGLALTYEDAVYTSRVGIDVSQHLGAIDWPTVRDAGVTFAFMRIGGRGYGEDGALYEDQRAMTNVAGAQESGLDVGVYFFSQAISEEEAVEEADFVLDILNGTPLELPIVYDPETIVDDVARTDDVSAEQFMENTRAFCDRIRAAGYEPMVYCNMMWEAFELDLAALQEADIPIWYADYETLPQTPYAFSFWQYASDAHVDGITGSVDLDVEIYEK